MAETYVVVGTQWGDEGKGKVIDVLGNKIDYVVRFQGGNNAGHTVVIGDEKIILHLLPSGVLHQNAKCIIGAGVVVDIRVLNEELVNLENKGFTTEHVLVDHRAHLIMPYHIAEDVAREKARGTHKIGTTKRGIGAAYMDKMNRVGLRVADLFEQEDKLRQKVNLILSEKNHLFKLFGVQTFSESEIMDVLMQYHDIVKKRNLIIDGVVHLNKAIDTGKKVLFEGAQAAMLDINHGTYPYVTSSSPTAGGVTTGAGIAPAKIKNVIGVAKAYATRVGSGVFPTELANHLGDRLRQIGNEFGATTGRARRVGWLDLVALKYAKMLNGLDYLVLTKLDVLTDFKTLKVAVGYEINGSTYDLFPSWVDQDTKINVIYKTFPGWNEDITNIRSYDELPQNAKTYLDFITHFIDTKLAFISVGPERTQNIYLHELIDE